VHEPVIEDNNSNFKAMGHEYQSILMRSKSSPLIQIENPEICDKELFQPLKF